VPDPFANLPAPSFSGTGTALNLSANQSLSIGPGVVVFSQITESGTAHLTIAPGTEVITTGGISVSGGASVSGTGVLLYNAGGGIAVSGNATLNLSAATSGPYAGLVIFQSRTDTQALNFSGNGVGSLSGTVYAPAAQVNLSGNASLQNVSLLCNTLTLSGNAGAFQLADGRSSDFLSSTSNQILVGVLSVAVEDDSGNGIDPGELARLGDALAYLNQALGSFGVNLTWAPAGTVADVTVHFASSTPYGGASAGVLGFTPAGNDVYLVTTGWNFYTGSDSSQIGAGQYDFQTLATHELAHTVGLGESSDTQSVMYEFLAAGTVRRTFTDGNLSLINTDADRYMKVAPEQAGTQPVGSPSAAVSGVDLRVAPALPPADSPSEPGPAPVPNGLLARPTVPVLPVPLSAAQLSGKPDVSATVPSDNQAVPLPVRLDSPAVSAPTPTVPLTISTTAPLPLPAAETALAVRSSAVTAVAPTVPTLPVEPDTEVEETTSVGAATPEAALRDTSALDLLFAAGLPGGDTDLAPFDLARVNLNLADSNPEPFLGVPDLPDVAGAGVAVLLFGGFWADQADVHRRRSSTRTQP
jgi:hypothetical protein